MGRHAAPSRSRGPLSRDATWSVVLGLVAVVVAVVVLVVVGAEARTALLTGAGLLLGGAVAFAVLRAAGLLAGPPRP